MWQRRLTGAGLQINDIVELCFNTHLLGPSFTAAQDMAAGPPHASISIAGATCVGDHGAGAAGPDSGSSICIAVDATISSPLVAGLDDPP